MQIRNEKMDFRKITDHLILLLVVAVAALGMAALVRLAALKAGLDTGTANIVFVCVIGACAAAYLVIMATLSDAVLPWTMKKLGFKERGEEPAESNGLTRPQFAYFQEAERMKQVADRMRNDELESNICLFQSYAHRVLGPFITPEEIKALDKFIECYARKQDVPDELPPLRPQELTTPDLFHFGWNMHNFFKQGKQGDVVPLLRRMFAGLKEMSPTTILGKLKHNERGAYTIPIVKDIARFMANRRQ